MRSQLSSASALSIAVCLSLSVAACDALKSADGDDAKPDADAKGDEGKGDEGNGGEPAKADAEGSAPDDAAGASVDGTVTFSVDGEAKSFDYIPKDNAVLMSISTNFIAKPDASSKEEFSVNLTHFDPRKAEFPLTLELDLKKQMQAKDPMAAAKAPKPLVAYQKADGTRYGGYVTIELESWKDGRLTGTIEDDELPAAEKGGDPIKLSDMKFSVQLD